MALKAMTSETTGAIVAAPTTSLPEDIGGVRNWDYRYCWLRDSVLALEALLAGGYTDEALGFRDFMARAGHGRSGQGPDHVRDRRRAAADGVRARRAARLRGLHPGPGRQRGLRAVPARRLRRGRSAWRTAPPSCSAVSRSGCGRAGARSIEYVESIWREPDDGIWESRGPRRHYTYSKVMAWVVFDRAVRLVERFGLDAPLERWKQVRDEIHREVCERGYDAERRTFTQYYGSRELDASVLNIPLVGFLPGPTSASPERSTRSRASWAATASSRATRRPRPTTDCPAAKGSSWPARSGWSTPWRSTAASTRRARCSSGCSG